MIGATLATDLLASALAVPPLFPLLPLRLHPGDDLRGALQAALTAHGAGAAFVISGIGSLRPACIRLAGADAAITLDDDLEVLTLAGTVAADGAHLHLSVSLPDGSVLGGHAAVGCTVRTTAEVLLVLLPGWDFKRVHDAATGFAELLPRTRQGPA